jgi:NAD(P)H-hydrate epimerase
VLTAAQMREADRITIQDLGIPSLVLMENAGRQVVAAIEAMFPKLAMRRVAVLAGHGNNGGDGFVIARHLEAAGHQVRVLLAAAPEAYAGDAAINLRIVERSGSSIICLATADEEAWRRELAGAAWIVDALLGTGAVGPPRGAIAIAITAINDMRAAAVDVAARVLAVDLPSGLDADTGEAAGQCVRADLTATFVAEKAGFANPAAAALTGTVHVLGIGAPAALLRRFSVRP